MKKVILSILSFVLALNVYSQSSSGKSTEPFQPGWNISAGAGINLYIAEGNEFWKNEPNKVTAFSLKENGGFVGRIGVGYTFTTVIGVRGIYAHLQHHWPDVRYKNADGSFRDVSFDADNLAADLMVNISNWWAGYNPNRKIDFSVFGGTGLAFRDKDALQSTKTSLIVRMGAQADYKLSRTLDINLSIQNNFVRDDYNGYVAHTPYELYTAFTAGFTYHFRGKAGKARLADVVPVIEPKEVVAEQAVVEPVKVAPAPERVAEPIVKKEPAPVAPKVEVVAEPVVKAAPEVSTDLPVNIFFPTNKVTIDNDTQRQAIARAAEYLKANPQATVSLCGYADKTTGSEALNMNLSAKRAQNVTKLLVTQYGISRNRIKANWYGDTVQPFKQDNMNRLVVIK